MPLLLTLCPLQVCNPLLAAKHVTHQKPPAHAASEAAVWLAWLYRFGISGCCLEFPSGGAIWHV